MEKQKEKICKPYANCAGQQLGGVSGNGNICGFTADDEQTENLFFKSESIETEKWAEELNSILFDKIQVTVCVAFEDGTSKTQTIAIAAAAGDANHEYEKGQTQREKLIQYEMR